MFMPLHRVVQRQVPRWMPQRPLAQESHACSRGHRRVARGLQRASALNFRLPAEFAAKYRATVDAPAAFQELV